MGMYVLTSQRITPVTTNTIKIVNNGIINDLEVKLKGNPSISWNCYIMFEINYIIHTFI